MSLGPDAAQPGIGTVIRAGFFAADALNRLIGGGLNRQERAAIQTARAEGYTRDRQGWISPDGVRMTERAVIAAVGTRGPVMPPAGTAPPYQSPIGRPGPTPPTMPRGGTAPPYQSPINADELRRYVEEQARRRAAEAARPPRFPRPPVVDPNATIARTVTSSARILSGVAGIIAGILYPTPTSSSDTIPGPMPGDSRGPTRRPVIRPRPPLPVPGRIPDILAPPVPGIPAPVPAVPSEPVLTSPQPTGPTFDPADMPTPTAPPAPTPATPSLPRNWAFLLPAVIPFLAPGSSSPPRVPLTPTQPGALQSPLTAAGPGNCPPCRCNDQRDKRKRKKDRCTNPITNRRTYTRGRTKFRTITRKLQCRV